MANSDMDSETRGFAMRCAIELVRDCDAILAFGSRAWGGCDELSDLDILVLRRDPPVSERVRRKWEGRVVDVHVHTPGTLTCSTIKQIQSHYNFFVHVLEQGVVILDNDGLFRRVQLEVANKLNDAPAFSGWGTLVLALECLLEDVGRRHDRVSVSLLLRDIYLAVISIISLKAFGWYSSVSVMRRHLAVTHAEILRSLDEAYIAANSGECECILSFSRYVIRSFAI